MCVVGVVLFAYFVWPTRHIYTHSQTGILVRIDRFTHKTEFFSLTEGWIDPGEAAREKRAKPPNSFLDELNKQR